MDRLGGVWGYKSSSGKSRDLPPTPAPALGLRCLGFGFEVERLRLRDESLLRVGGLGCGVWGLGCLVSGLGSRVEGFGFAFGMQDREFWNCLRTPRCWRREGRGEGKGEGARNLARWSVIEGGAMPRALW